MIPDLRSLSLGHFIKSEVKLLNMYMHITHHIGTVVGSFFFLTTQ